MLSGRNPTRDEASWLDMVKQTPCIACAQFHDEPNSVSEIHHIEGKTKALAHKKSFALCAFHHRIKDNQTPPRWVSRHGDGKRAFEERYMTEEAFLMEQTRQCKRIKSNQVGG